MNNKLYYVLFVLILISDQITKIFARSLLQVGQSINLIEDHIKFQLVHNTGAFLSLGSSWSGSLRWAILIVFVVFLLYFLWRLMTSSETPKRHKICYAVILGGGVGNLIDRIILGEVTDFLWIGFGPLQTGVFNIADMGILFGVLVLLIEPLFLKVHSKN